MPPSPEAESGPSRVAVWQMFDRIAHRYDLLNRLLSMGRDVAWRKMLVKRLPAVDNPRVLDLATGTADVLFAMERALPTLEQGVGLDMSAGMLSFGRQKVLARGLERRLSLVRADATRIPFEDNSFDAVSISFGIRNVLDMDEGLREMCRVLRPGGRALILEFSLPANRPFRALYLFYFRHILPRIGGLISGDSYAYRYLNETVESFPYGSAFTGRMAQAGFGSTSATPLTLGIATLYTGDKPE
ncbi:MAG: bifunctional demethylmenaquinone methyltransferase/2-methoxy-6-polyprenyl-1,4-benzoquinol methylase UbiE [Candidatus Hydrogenedentes bacterium]|nr:bifunctional demethylmenaquinone methyltransferase/2-methoxy-6-polyprenyl-1,4-benzoquinol methylase UbiE [Candidatus Hydrogenedentota bacterium]